MPRFLFLCLFFISLVILPTPARSQNVTAYISDSLSLHKMDSLFESVRKNPNRLRMFLREMPKGGDLHHHYAGAIYPENLVRVTLQENLHINPLTLEVKEKLTFTDGGFERAQVLNNLGKFDAIREKLLRAWSIKDFNRVAHHETKSDFFFHTFHRFSAPLEHAQVEALLSFKRRALAENVSYIETMFGMPDNTPLDGGLRKQWNATLRQIQNEKNEARLYQMLDSFYNYLHTKNNLVQNATLYAKQVDKLHESLALDDNFFTIRYQNYVLRTLDPAQVFQDLSASFLSAQISPYIVGVNIVGEEHNPVAIENYWLHIHFYAYLHKKFPHVKYALHAGELTLTNATPENLSFHIHDALNVAGASRIGHGVDIAHENKAEGILKTMAQKKIPVEIAITSNAFILGIKAGAHPIMLYHHYGVPIVVATDDAGVLRTTLTEEFVKVALQYPALRYEDLKNFVFNSITYSFIDKVGVREKMTSKLKRDFLLFEKKWEDEK